MKFIRTFVLYLYFVLLFTLPSKATHLLGGEISYRPLGDNNYEFTMRILRDPSSYNRLSNPATISVYDTAGRLVDSIKAYLTDSLFIHPNDTGTCAVMTYGNIIQEGIYIFNIHLPALPGGYTVAYQTCCRGIAAIDLLNPVNLGGTYFVTLNDADLVMQNTSPVFKNSPPEVICYRTPIVFDQSAFDVDGDSLIYGLAAPYNYQFHSSGSGNVDSFYPPPYSTVVYRSGFSYGDPIIASPALAIDARTGLLTLIPIQIGEFVIGINVSEYRNGALLGNYLRDFDIQVTSCSSSKVLASFTDTVSGLLAVFNSGLSTGAVRYHWDFGDGETDSIANPTHIYKGNGKYEACLKATNADGCSSIQCLPVTISAGNICNAFFICYKDSVMPNHWYVLNKSTGKKPLNYRWCWGDGTTSLGITPSHIYGVGGDYSICLTISDDTSCSSTYCDSLAYFLSDKKGLPVTLDVVNELPNGIKPLVQNINQLLVYPNPCNACIIKGIDNVDDILITDVLGRSINATLIKTSSGAQIDLTGNQTGFFIVRNLRTGQVVKFIRQ